MVGFVAPIDHAGELLNWNAVNVVTRYGEKNINTFNGVNAAYVPLLTMQKPA
jgi:hypothetical protein